MERIFLSIIIPCFNEHANIKRGVLGEVRDFLKDQDFAWEVIISDDGSTDGSSELVEREIKNWKNFRLLKIEHGGKPMALWNGVKASNGLWILFTDMDQSTPINELTKLLPFVKKGCKAVIGSRGTGRKKFPFYRRVGALVFMNLRRALLLSNIKDTQCGFKLFDRNSLIKYFPRLSFFKRKIETKGWLVSSWDVEFLHILDKNGISIKEVTVEWDDKDISQSKGGYISKYFRESRDMLREIITVKLNDVRGQYN